MYLTDFSLPLASYVYRRFEKIQKANHFIRHCKNIDLPSNNKVILKKENLRNELKSLLQQDQLLTGGLIQRSQQK